MEAKLEELFIKIMSPYPQPTSWFVNWKVMNYRITNVNMPVNLSVCFVFFYFTQSSNNTVIGIHLHNIFFIYIPESIFSSKNKQGGLLESNYCDNFPDGETFSALPLCHGMFTFSHFRCNIQLQFQVQNKVVAASQSEPRKIVLEH